MTAASGADRTTLRDQLAEVLANLLGNDGNTRYYDHPPAVPRAAKRYLAVLLPLIEADRERAKAEGGAEALEALTREFPLPIPVTAIQPLRDRAAALRGET